MSIFQRFTDQAIKVIMLAQEESRRLGHNFVGTEQILLGLSGEGTGVAAKVLKSMGVNLKDARIEVEKIIGRGSGFVADDTPFTTRAKQVFELSLEEARQRGHNYIGTEHLLLGLIREGEGVGVRVLENLGADLARVRTEVILMLGETVEITAVSDDRRTKMPRWEEIWADLAQMAADGKIAPDMVQQKKIKPVIEILGSTKSNPQKSSLSKKKAISNPLWRMLERQVIKEQYFLQKLLGEGGYGAVYLADEVLTKRDKQLEQVAVKLILSDDTTESQLDELIVTRKLLHPNLTGCFDRGECNLMGADYLYLLMELADFSLEKQLNQGILSQAETILLVKDIAEALVYLHNQVVVLPNQPKPVTLAHRDLKPGNILRIGNKWKLSDFGLVKIIGSGSVLNTSNLFGTPLYLPPESYEGKICPAWDVWALGIVIVEALTGKLPFNGETLQQLQKQVCEQEPDLSGLPQKFEPLVRGCLEKDRHKRWTAKQVLEQIPVSKSGYVLLYNAGLEYEGIYTIQRGEYNQVIIFEEEGGAHRFSSYLEGQGFTNISVEFFEEEDINNFCNCLNFDVEWIASGEEVIFNENNLSKTQQFYVLLYNVGTENEGIHTIDTGDRHKVLIFENQEDAHRFSDLLEAQNFPRPSVESIDVEKIKNFCKELNYDYELIRAGTLAIPPEGNVEKLAFETKQENNSFLDGIIGFWEGIKEVWNGSNELSKSEIFVLEKAPDDSPLPTNRSEAKILKLENWD
jgi:ATP-dependent Clp protease ATP-binding subunit ClpC